MASTLEFYNRNDSLEILATIDVDEFLESRLTANDELDKKFQDYKDSTGQYDSYHTALKFAESLDGGGIYGEGEPFVVNTYNGEDLLSEVIQYVYWTDEDGAHVLLERHHGGDVRGNYGYGPIEAFDLDDYDETGIFDNARATIYCNGCDKYWYTDDSYHWYPEGCYGKGYTQLEEYPAIDERPNYRLNSHPDQCFLPGVDKEDLTESCTDVVWVDDDRNGHCPYCGGLLEVSNIG